MNNDKILAFICRRIEEIAVAKGAGPLRVDGDTAILGGALPLDSLDLAAIVVQLETETGQDPFKEGFINFRTVGQLADLYCGGQ